MNQCSDGKRNALNFNITHTVQSSVKDRLDSLVDLEIENAGELSPQTWKIVAHNITKSIKESPAMLTLLQDIGQSLSSNVECFVSNIENQPISEFSKAQVVSNGPLGEILLHGTSDSLIQYKQIANETLQHKPLKTRKQALNTFLHCVLSEVVNNKYWPEIRRNLRENLCEENDEVFNLCLKIHGKLIQSSSQICVREGFINLVEGLHLYYSNIYHNSLPNLKSGIDLNNTTHHHLCQISHLIIQTAKEMPKNWLRYGERRVEEIIGVFINILAMHTNCSKLNLSKEILYPFHIFSVLDPKASWCKQWVHGLFGQNLLLNTFTQNLTLINCLIEDVLSYLEQNESEHAQEFHQNNITGHILKFAIFSHSVNVLNKIVSNEKGRNCFPLSLKPTEEPLTLDSVLVMMVNYLNSQSNYDSANCGLEIITEFVRNASKAEYKEISENFVTAVMEPIQNVHTQRLNFLSIPSHTINIILELINENTSVSFLLGKRYKSRPSHMKFNRNQNNTNLSATGVQRNRNINMSLDRQYSAKWIKIPSKSISDPTCPAKCIEHFTTSLIRNNEISQINILLPLIDICGKLFIIHEGLSMLDSSNSHLISSIVNLYKQMSCENESVIEFTSFGFTSKTTEYRLQSQSLYRSLVQFLSSVASTPCGVYALAQKDAILQDLLMTLLQISHVPWENPEFRYLISLITSVPQSLPVLSEECHRILSQSLSNLQCIYEDPFALMTGSDRKQFESTQNFINIIFTFVPNLLGVTALLNECEGSNEGTLVEADSCPSSLSELLVLDSVTEPWHYISLLTLRALLSNLDVCLYLSTLFQFQDKLLKLQSENVSADETKDEEARKLKSNSPNKSIIIDQCSILRHQILLTSYAIGGPSERLIPTSSVDSEDDEPELFSSLPPPQFTSARSAARSIRSTRHKSQTDLQRFLQDTKQGLHDANWLSHGRRAYKSSRNDDVKAHVLLDLLDQVAKMNSRSVSYLTDAYPDVEDSILHPEEHYGIQLVIRYGVTCHLLQENSQSEENMSQLLHISHSLLKQKNSSAFQGFDWFMGTVFLLCGGNLDRCRSTIENLASLPVAPFIWRFLAAAQESSSQHEFMFGHLLELLVKIELPLAFSALKLAGASWWLICRQWMAQCFWNVLDWSQICHWLAVGILNQPDYMLYFCVSLLRHMQPQILQASTEGTIWEQIMIVPVEGFQVGEQLSYMEKLAKRHRTSVLHHLTVTPNSAA